MYGSTTLAVLVLPFVALVVVGFGIPLGRAVVESLTAGESFGENYGIVLRERIFWVILERTFRQAAMVAIVCVVMAYMIAQLIWLAPRVWRPLLLALVVIPLWSSAIARTYSWVGVFQRDGVVDRIVGVFGAGPQQLLFSQPAVVVGMVHVMLPFAVLPAYGAMRAYDESLSRASLSLGAGRLRTLFRIKLPLLAPQLAAAGVAIFVLSLGFYLTPAVLGGPRSQMTSNLIAQQVFQRFDLARGYAISVLLVVATVVVLVILGGMVKVGRAVTR